MKRILASTILVMLLLGLLTFPAAADGPVSGISDTLRYEVIYEDEIIITGYTDETPANLIIPETINGLPVRYIMTKAFQDCEQLTSVTLPDTLIEIDGYAFANTNLSGFVDIPESVTEIGSNAFYNSPILGIRFLGKPLSMWESGREETLAIVFSQQYASLYQRPEGFSAVRIYAEDFDEGLLHGYRTVADGCTYLVGDTAAHLIEGVNQQSVSIPAQVDGKPVRGILEEAFYQCRSVQSISLPEGLEYIGESAIHGTSITAVKLPSTIKRLDTNAFYGNENLKSVYLDVPYIGDNAFSYCGLETVAFGPSVRHIGEAAFTEAKIREVTVPEGVEELHFTFLYCTNLTKITLPESLRVFDGAVQGCTALTELKLPSGVTEVSRLVQENAVASIEIPAGVRVLDSKAFGLSNQLQELILNEGLERIEASALTNCTKLRELRLPASLQTMESVPDAPLLTIYYHSGTVIEPDWVPNNRATYVNLDTGEKKQMNYQVTVDNQTFFVYENYAKLDNVWNYGQMRITVPDEVDGRPVTVIGACAFNTLPCRHIDLPRNLERMEENAIYNCFRLIGLHLPSSLQAVPDENGETGKMIGGGGIEGYYYFSAEEGSFAEAYIKEYYKGTTTVGLFLYTGENPYIFENNHAFRVEDGEATLLLSMERDGITEEVDRVPGEVDGVPVTSVAKEAYCHTLYPGSGPGAFQQVVFEAPLQKIEDGAFPDGYTIAITIPKTVTEIGDDALGKGSVTIYCAPGSYAEEYAITHGYAYDNGALPFTDVPRDAWYTQAVRYCYWAELMNGTSATTFEPQGITTRAMMVQVLYNMAGDQMASTMPEGYRPGFTDVVPGAWYDQAVCWAEYYGIVNGVSATSFKPNDPVSREQLVTIIYRFASGAGLDKGQRQDLSGYTDGAAVSSWAKDSMEWAVAAGIINGTSPTTLSPGGSASRAEIAAILMRFANLLNA